MRMATPQSKPTVLPAPQTPGSHRFVQAIGSLVQRVRVSGGHLCEAEAPTEAAAETLSTELIEGYLFEIKLFTML